MFIMVAPRILICLTHRFELSLDGRGSVIRITERCFPALNTDCTTRDSKFLGHRLENVSTCDGHEIGWPTCRGSKNRFTNEDPAAAVAVDTLVSLSKCGSGCHIIQKHHSLSHSYPHTHTLSLSLSLSLPNVAMFSPSS